MIAHHGNKQNLLPGRPWPLGASCDEEGINFAISSKNATALELCLFSDDGTIEMARHALPARTNDVWHGYLPGGKPGQVYGLRAHGPWRPDQGLRFNPHKLLLDPYAREILGHFDWRDEHFAHDRQDSNVLDPRDNAPWALKAKVARGGPKVSGKVRHIANPYDWEGDQPLRTPIDRSVIYEMHVRGFSKCNLLVPEALRGTFAGLAHPASIAHLKALGISAVQLLPVHFAIDEERLVKMGLRNYWGYNTLGFFCLNPSLVSAPSKQRPADEFRDMVKALHRAGIEVLLDVVYNHTAESEELGPTLSFRGLDNSTFYRLEQNNLALYENHTGCGNTLDIRQARVLQLVLDSLRYWVEEMHVDGFRFDLATVLGRGDQGFEPESTFFQAIAQDPTLSQVKLIAEPWDIGPGGYQVGRFPPGWLEWNDQFRDTMRRFWLHQHQPSIRRGEFAMRLAGSADLYQSQRRAPATSINYIVSHDGFTLRDLVSFNTRRNAANGEDNRDGHGNNLSFNCGMEGPSENPEVNHLRARLQRTLLGTSILAQGTPMLCAGDELGHSQGGNNNPYCQDNEITWIDWRQADRALIQFTSHVIALRKLWMPFKKDWATGRPDASGQIDVVWQQPDGTALQPQDWQDPQFHGLAGCLTNGELSFVILFNPGHQGLSFNLPLGAWDLLLDTALPLGYPTPSDPRPHEVDASLINSGTESSRPSSLSISLEAHTLVLLKRRNTT
jgi:glycogen debranching enzyme GlgX